MPENPYEPPQGMEQPPLWRAVAERVAIVAAATSVGWLAGGTRFSALAGCCAGWIVGMVWFYFRRVPRPIVKNP